MRKRPQPLATEQDLYDFALQALMRRAHSMHEMRGALERRSTDQNAIRNTLLRLKEAGYLNDARFAVQFARSQAQNRKRGRARVLRELRARGVPEALIEAALAEVFAEVDEAAMVRARLGRKLRGMRGPLDRRKAASLYASLVRAGYAPEVVRRELRALRGAAAEVADASEFTPDHSAEHS